MTINATFEEARIALENGNIVCRNKFYKTEEVIFRQVPSRIPINVIPNMTSLPQKVKDLLIDKAIDIYYDNQLAKLYTKTGYITTYVPTAEDIFANDWIIF
jgi:hypothetical protein